MNALLLFNILALSKIFLFRLKYDVCSVTEAFHSNNSKIYDWFQLRFHQEKKITSLLKKAGRRSTPTTYTCRFCKKAFLRRSYSTDHERSVHQGVFHRCDICGAKFAYSNNLLTHRRTVHKEQRYMLKYKLFYNLYR